MTPQSRPADHGEPVNIRAAVADGASLREVGEAVGLSHTAVKFIAHGRPSR